MSDLKEDRFQYALRLGDTSLILAHRLSELCSKGPYLEEDIALSNIALDMLGRAELFLEYAGELEGKNRSADDLTFRRNERQYFNHLLVERPNGDFGQVIMRQFLNDALIHPLFSGLKLSKDEHFAAIAEKAVKESAYHIQHSREWVVRLAQGTDESRTKITEALNDLWMYTGEMFEWSDGEKEMAKNGIIPSFEDLKKSWTATVKETLNEAGLEMPAEQWMATGGREGIHSEYLGHMLGDMQFLQRAYPNDKW